MDLDAVIAACQLSHRRLRHTLGRIDDGDEGQACRLPGWTIGHTLTHLARNAESHIRILDGALAGEHLEQYAGGVQQRAADIETGAGRTAMALVDDVVDTFARLEGTWDRMTPEAWAGHGLSRGHEWPCRHLPFFRWREVEIHHVDLGLGYQVTDWPAEYVAAELPMALARLTERMTGPADRAHMLAWLIGRDNDFSDVALEPWQSNSEHYLIPGD
jgi:maleylpyruvate isomerase